MPTALPRARASTRRRAFASDLGLDEHPDGVERRGDVVVALRAVAGLEDQGEPRAVAVRVDPHPSVVAAGGAPFDPALAVVNPEGSLAVLLVSGVARVDLHAITGRPAGGGHLRHEPRQVAEVG